MMIGSGQLQKNPSSLCCKGAVLNSTECSGHTGGKKKNKQTKKHILITGQVLL